MLVMTSAGYLEHVRRHADTVAAGTAAQQLGQRGGGVGVVSFVPARGGASDRPTSGHVISPSEYRGRGRKIAELPNRDALASERRGYTEGTQPRLFRRHIAHERCMGEDAPADVESHRARPDGPGPKCTACA